MDVKKYIDTIKNIDISDDAVACVEKLFNVALNDDVRRAVSVVLNDYFISEKCRVISLNEILRTEDFIGVDFKKLNMIPLIDCKDDDYIVFNFETQKYEMYNIYDEVSFRETDSLEEMLATLE